MADKLDQLKARLAETYDIWNAASVLNWDQETYMPEGGAEARGEALATLEKIAHEKFTEDAIGKLLEDLASSVADLDPDSDDARTGQSHPARIRQSHPCAGRYGGRKKHALPPPPISPGAKHARNQTLACLNRTWKRSSIGPNVTPNCSSLMTMPMTHCSMITSRV